MEVHTKTHSHEPSHGRGELRLCSASLGPPHLPLHKDLIEDNWGENCQE